MLLVFLLSIISEIAFRADIAVDHSSLSRAHTVIAYEKNGKVSIIDMSSKNGTFVNGKKLAPRVEHWLKLSDPSATAEVTFGSAPVVFRLAVRSDEKQQIGADETGDQKTVKTERASNSRIEADMPDVSKMSDRERRRAEIERLTKEMIATKPTELLTKKASNPARLSAAANSLQHTGVPAANRESLEKELSGKHGSSVAVTDLPVNSMVRIYGHKKAVSCLALDKTGRSLVTGSYDYSVKFYDFSGMASRNQLTRLHQTDIVDDAADEVLNEHYNTSYMDFNQAHFKDLIPEDGKQIVGLSFSAKGGHVLVIPGGSKAKVFSRNGEEALTTTRGDPYLHSMRHTKGHTTTLTGGVWHPTVNSQFLTSSMDGTIRLWNMAGERTRLDADLISSAVLQPTDARGSRLKITTFCIQSSEAEEPESASSFGEVSGSPYANILCAGCTDGTLQLWGCRKGFSDIDTKKKADLTVDYFSSHSGSGSGPGSKRNKQWTNRYCTFTGLDMHGDLLAVRTMDTSPCPELSLFDVRYLKVPVKSQQYLTDNNFCLSSVRDAENTWPECSVKFCPKGRFIITGTSARRNSESYGKLLIWDVENSSAEDLVALPIVKGASVVSVLWHQTADQIFVGCEDSSVRVLFRDEIGTGASAEEARDERGILTSIIRSRARTIKSKSTSASRSFFTNAEFKVNEEDIYYPNALPMFQDKDLSYRGRRRKREQKAEATAESTGQGQEAAGTQQQLPEKPPDYLTAQYNPHKKLKDDEKEAKLQKKNETFADIIYQNLKPGTNVPKQDPREELFKYQRAESNPQRAAGGAGFSWVESAYKKSQPKNILAEKTLEQEEEEIAKMREDLKEYQDAQNKEARKE